MVLLRTAAQELDLSPQADGFETTSSGRVGSQFGRLHELMVGSTEFRDLTVTLPAAEPSNIGDGPLPTTLFSALYINSRERFVVLNPPSREKLSGGHLPE